MTHILFAIAPTTPTDQRKVIPALVAERFDGIAATTELVGIRNFGRLYRMASRFPSASP